MFPNRAIRALRSQPQQCTRSIQSSARQLAEEPKRSNRKARSQKISDEVAKLQQGPPPSAPAPQPPTASAGFLDTPSTTAPGRMGQNEPAQREGINAQGIGKVDTMSEPHEGGVDVLTAAAPGKGEVAVEPFASVPEVKGPSYAPQKMDVKALLRRGEGTATIAGGNYAGVIEDRVHHVVEPGRRSGNVTKDGQKSEQGQFVRLIRGPDEATRKYKKKYRLKEEVRESIVGKLVRGNFDRTLVRKEGQQKAHPVDEIRRKLAINGTYLEADKSKLLNKVRSFLTEEQWKRVQLGAR